MKTKKTTIWVHDNIALWIEMFWMLLQLERIFLYHKETMKVFANLHQIQTRHFAIRVHDNFGTPRVHFPQLDTPIIWVHNYYLSIDLDWMHIRSSTNRFMAILIYEKGTIHNLVTSQYVVSIRIFLLVLKIRHGTNLVQHNFGMDIR